MVAWDVALRNAAALFGRGIEPYEPTPSAILADAPHRRLRRYCGTEAPAGNPVLLVPPLAVSISCYDLRPAQSLVRFLQRLGREVYVVEYGDITYADRHLGFEEWVDDIVPGAIRRVSAEHGELPVDLIGWSFGGTMSLLTAAGHAGLPIASVTAVGSPFDQRRNGQIALARMFGQLTGGLELTVPLRITGGVSKYAVRAGFRAQSFDRELLKPLYIARNIGDTEALARMESIDRFMDRMPGYPGRFYRQAYTQLILRNEMYRGVVHLSPRRAVELAKLVVPVLLVGGTRDKLAAAPAVAAGQRVLTGSPDVRYVEVDGSHLGIIAGAEAPATTWAAIAEFLSVGRLQQA